MALLAQHGYGKGEKINVGLANDEISGVIFSPKAENLIKLKVSSKKIKKINSNAKIYFDPQFYICNLQGDVNFSKFASYEYCSMSIDRNTLSDFFYLNKMCKQVFDIQDELGVSSYFSPTIMFSDFEDKESQIALNLANLSYENISNANSRLYISLCINEAAFNDFTKMNAFLDTITLLDVKGFYIIIDRNVINNRSNEINSNVLLNIMTFIYSLSILNKFDVIIGYSDLVSIPLAAVSNADFASGWFSNTKRFSASSFLKSNGGQRPKKRYTSGVLINTILLLPELKSIIDLNLTNKVMSESPYNINLLPKFHDNQWSDEVSCLHNWHVINQLLKLIQSNKNIEDRLSCLQTIIQTAKESSSIIKTQLQMNFSYRDNHLDMWDEALKSFKERMV